MTTVRRRAKDGGDGHSDVLLPPGWGEGWGGARRRRIMRPWMKVAVVIAFIIVAAVIVVVVAPSPSMKVTGVYAYQVGRLKNCQAAVTVRGDIVTNGSSGTARYEWVRPDGMTSPVTTLSFGSGQTIKAVRMTWTFPPSDNGELATAVLKVLSPNASSARAELFYDCL